MKYLLLCFLFSVFFIGCGDSLKQGQPFALGEPYTRSIVKNDGTGRLEMSAKSFIPINGDGPKVTLVGMIHIGEPSYYQQVQERIDEASSVLW